MARSLNILIVDDNRIMRAMVARSVAMCGLKVGDVHQACDGDQALEALRTLNVDVVLSDVNMPVMDGITMVEHMTADALLARVPVVIVSSERSESRMRRLGELGVRSYLQKPFTPEQLGAALRSALSIEVES